MIRSAARLALALSAVILLLPGAASARRALRASDCVGADLVPTALTMNVARKATMCLVNVERQSRGLHALRDNPRIDKAATAHSRDMVSRGYFDHVTPNGGDPVSRLLHVHYLSYTSAGWSVGEDLAWGTGIDSTPREIVKSWMESPPHRANILHASFRDAGVGVALGAPESTPLPGVTYTLDFGRRG